MIGLTIAIVLLFSAVTYLRSIKVSSFVHAIEELIAVKTNNAYSLSIGNAQLDLMKLTFVLDNVVISKTDTVGSSGLQSVVIPKVNADLGSIKSLFSIHQIDIRNLSIDEPYVKIKTGPSKQEQNLSIFKQFAKLYPSIEAVLEKFDVSSFSIKKGALNLSKDNTEINIGLIDFLVTNWNVRRDNEPGSVQLTLEKQKLILGETAFNFSSIEYRFPEHYLLFHDFSFSSVSDTAFNSIIKGKKLMLSGLDYDEFEHNGRVVLRAIEIDYPQYEHQIVVDENESAAKFDLQKVFPVFMKIVDDVELDSLIINKGSAYIKFVHPNDETRLVVPAFDLLLTGINLKKTASASSIKDIYFDLYKSTIDNSIFSVSIDTLIFSDRELLSLRNLSFDHQAFGSAEIPLLEIQRPDLLEILEKRILRSGPVSIKHPDINLNFVKLTEHKNKHKSNHNILFEIQSINLENGTIQYQSADLNFSGKGLNVSTGMIDHKNATRPLEILNELKLSELSLLHRNGLSVSGENGILNNGNIWFENIDLDQKDMHFKTRNIHVEYKKIHLKDSIIIKSLSASSLLLSGSLPLPAKHIEKNTRPVSIDLINIKSIGVNLNQSGKKIRLNGSSLVVSEIRVGGKFYFEHIEAKIRNLTYEDSISLGSVANMDLNSSKNSTFENVNLSSHNLKLVLQRGSISPFEFEGQLKIPSFSLYEVNFESKKAFKMKADSVSLTSLLIVKEGKPKINDIVVYKPIANIEMPSNKEKKSFAFPKELPVDIGNIKFEKAGLSFGGNNVNFESADIQLPLTDITINVDGLEFLTPKSNITVGSIAIHNHALEVKNAKISPTQAALDTQQYQHANLDVALSSLKTSHFDLIEILETSEINLDSIWVNSAILTVMKDNRFALDTIHNKPLLISQMLPKNFLFKFIDINDSRVLAKVISERTALTSDIELNKINAEIWHKSRGPDFNGIVLSANTQFYHTGSTHLYYEELNVDEYFLEVKAKDLDLTALNTITEPLLALNIKEGLLGNLHVKATANATEAAITTNMTYDHLHIEIFKHDTPHEKTLGSELITLLADGVILRHSRDSAIIETSQDRIEAKAIFNYWVRILLRGSLQTIRHGKETETESDRKKKR